MALIYHISTSSFKLNELILNKNKNFSYSSHLKYIKIQIPLDIYNRVKPIIT